MNPVACDGTCQQRWSGPASACNSGIPEVPNPADLPTVASGGVCGACGEVGRDDGWWMEGGGSGVESGRRIAPAERTTPSDPWQANGLASARPTSAAPSLVRPVSEGVFCRGQAARRARPPPQPTPARSATVAHRLLREHHQLLLCHAVVHAGGQPELTAVRRRTCRVPPGRAQVQDGGHVRGGRPRR